MCGATCENNILDNLLEDIIKEEGIYNSIITKNEGSVKGDGYSGEIICIKIEGNDKNNKQKLLHLIAKKAHTGEALRSEPFIEDMYKREIYMYNTIFPLYYNLEREKGLPPSFLAPKYYRSSTVKNHEVMILENLKKDGYRLHERRIPMNEDHVALVMSEYGRLHALSFALRDQQPETFNRVRSSMDDYFIKSFIKYENNNIFLRRCENNKNLLDANDKETLSTYEAFIHSIPSFLNELLKCVDDYSVVLHGDCWNSNMLFKYEGTSNASKPTGVCFIDFQLSRLGSPALDLSYFFYTCSSKHIIDNHSYYLKLYYKSFAYYLRKLGSDPEKLYPYSVLEDHWKKYARFGLLFSSLVIYIMLTEKNEVIDVSEKVESGTPASELFDYEITNVDVYNKRMKDVIMHFINYNYI